MDEQYNNQQFEQDHYQQSNQTCYQYQQGYSQQKKSDDDAMAIGSLVCGILSFFLPICCIPGLILGLMAKKRTQGENKTMATVGFLCSVIVLGLWLVILVLCMLFFLWTVFALSSATYGAILPFVM